MPKCQLTRKWEVNIKKVFVDENVIIDMFDKNRKNCIVANMIMNYCVYKDIELYTNGS